MKMHFREYMSDLHSRNSVMEGEKQGVKIGKYVFKNNLRERRDLI